MGDTIAQKLIRSHLVSGDMSVPGSEIGLKIDQTLTQDATGTMAYLEFEAMGVDQVKTERSVAYIDHNTLQTGFETPTTMLSSRAWLGDTAYCFPSRATASATGGIWKATENREKPCWVLTATLRPAAGWA